MFSQRSTDPISRIPAGASPEDVCAWFETQRCLAGVPSDEAFMLAAESGDWLHAHFSTRLTWRHLWDGLLVRDFMLLNADRTEVLGISEEEHEFLALRFTARK